LNVSKTKINSSVGDGIDIFGADRGKNVHVIQMINIIAFLVK